ncbi:MAG: ABC transporter permease [Planctomycetota bacterium]
MGFVTAPFSLLWRHRHLLMQTTRNDIRARYAGSVFGMAWLVLLPILFLTCYAGVQLYIYQVRKPDMSTTEWVAFVFCGLIPFIGFSEALALGTSSVTSNANLIKNTLFPIELIPVKAVLTSQCSQTVSTAILLIALAFLGCLGPWALLLPVIWLAQVLFTVGVIWFFASLNVYFRDLQNVVGIINLMLMMITPFGLTPEAIPAGIRPYLGANPLYYMIMCYQDCLKLGRFPQGHALWILLGLAGVFFLCGHWFFSKMKLVFADNV